MTSEVPAAEAVALLQRLIGCDTSNPPGAEAQAAAILEGYFEGTGVLCERVSKDEARPNLIARLPGRGGPSLAFLGHLDVVQARREDWSVEPFGGIVKDGAVWGRGAVDMKSQVAAVAVALASLAKHGFRPAGDVMLIAVADEEVGDAGVGAPYLVEARPDLSPDFLVGEGAGERFETTRGPVYLLDCGVKCTATATVTVRGRALDASLPIGETNAALHLGRLLVRLDEYRSPVRVVPEMRPLLDLLAPGEGSDEERVARARAAGPALDPLIGALVGSVIQPTLVEVKGPANVIPEVATMELQCIVLPGTTKHDLERELRVALGDGDYDLEVTEPQGGLISKTGSALHVAIEEFLRECDPDATLVPALGYGFSDCHAFREAYGTTAYGFIPFRHGDPMTNLTSKHSLDERVLIDDLAFQIRAAMHLTGAVGAGETANESSGRP